MKRSIFYTILAVYFVALAVLYFLRPFSESTTIVFQNIAYTLAPIIATLAGIGAYKKVSDAGMKRFILFLTLAAGAWLVGELIWIYYEVIIAEVPYPGIADMFYLVAYPLMLLAIFSKVKLGNINMQSSKFILSFILIIALSIITFQVSIVSAYDLEATPLLNIVNLGYGIVDLMVLVAVLFLVNVTESSAYSKAWGALIFAMGITWVADILYSLNYDAYNEFLYPARYLDLLWVAWYLLIAYAFEQFKGQPELKPAN